MTKLGDIWKNRTAILEGIKNSIFPKEEIEAIAAERLSVCKACFYHSSNAKSRGYITRRSDDHCTHCSCPLLTKTRALSTSCPINKWGAVISSKEQIVLDGLKSNRKEDDNKERSVEGSVQGTELSSEGNQDS